MSAPATVTVPELVYHRDGAMALADDSPAGVHAATLYLAWAEPGVEVRSAFQDAGDWRAETWQAKSLLSFGHGLTRRLAESVAVAHVLADQGLAGVVGEAGISVTAPASFTAEDLAALVPVVARA